MRRSAPPPQDHKVPNPNTSGTTGSVDNDRHHDKIVISAPDATRRQQLLQAFADDRESFADVSHFECESDEELFGPRVP